MAEFLLEIGCEELPAGWLQGITKELRERFAELAGAEHLEPKNVEAHSTPRRLVVRADVLARQPDREERVWGPRFTASKDKDGNWTAAARGFAQKNRIEVDQIQFAPKLAYVGAGDAPFANTLRKVPGRPSIEVLPGVIAAVLRAQSFPKRMSWDAWLDDGKGVFPFGRPIRWLVALLDQSVVPFSIHDLVSGGKGRAIVVSSANTRGHRFFPRESAQAEESPRKVGWAEPLPHPETRVVRVESFSDLRDKLRSRFVLLLREERLARIDAQLRNGLSSRLLEVKGASYLRDQWADLVEFPSVVFGRIPSEFHELPLEVVATVLVHHQKYIPTGSPGAGVSGFVAVTDTDGANSTAIARGMERVVVARLRDAAFFLREDLKRPLLDRVADLAGATFHARLGSYKDKTERIVRLAFVMGAQLGYLSKPEWESAQAAAQVCKADLTTLMVREFTELQGVMGGIYLRRETRPETLAKTVQWHYHPLSVEETDPPAGQLTPEEARIFAAVSLADKVDTLAGYFGIGEDPTGSRDPYGLRRAAQGAVRVLLDFWQSEVVECPNLSALVREAIKGYGNSLNRDPEELARSLEGFLLERLAYVFETRGFPKDEIRAALHPEDDDPGPAFAKGPLKIQALENVRDAHSRLKALHDVRAEAPEEFASLATAFKRAKNILEQSKEPAAPEVRPQLFEGDAERALYQAVSELGIQNGGYESRLRALATLREPVDRFFDPERGVFVMTDDAALRANRLALLERMRRLFYRIADISKLGG